MRDSSLRAVFLLAMVATVMIGCGGDSSTKNEADTILKGIWKTECVDQSTTTLDISNTQINSSIYTYSDDDCTATSVTESYTYDYVLGADVADVADAKELTLTMVASRITLHSDAVVSAMNQIKYCQIADWIEGIEREVTGKDCNGHTALAGTKHYTMAKVEDVSLWLGDETAGYDGKTPETREQLNASLAYARQQAH